MRANDQDTMGIETTGFLKKFNIQYGVFGVGGLNKKGQLLDYSPEESSVSRTIIENSEARILVADHSKFDRFAPVITGELTDIDFLVMDFISDPIRQLCLQLEIEMLEAGPAPKSASC